MMTIAICEDESYFSNVLYEMVDQYLKEKQIDAAIIIFDNGEDLLNSEQRPDIILMDIKLPGHDGMKIAEQLRNRGSRGQFIFITSYREYVFQAFDVEAIHYILKPASASQLYSAMDKAIKRAVCDLGKTLLLTIGNVSSRILIMDIIYCEVFNHQIYIHTMTEKYSYSGTLDFLEKKLDDSFFRCHRSFLVNMNFVIDREGEMAVMAGGNKVLIARRKQQEFTRKLLETCRGGAI